MFLFCLFHPPIAELIVSDDPVGVKSGDCLGQLFFAPVRSESLHQISQILDSYFPATCLLLKVNESFEDVFFVKLRVELPDRQDRWGEQMGITEVVVRQCAAVCGGLVSCRGVSEVRRFVVR